MAQHLYEATGTSRFGSWSTEQGLPCFFYVADPSDPVCEWDPIIEPPTHDHWVAVGNRRLQLLASSDGTVAVWDTAEGYRWLTAVDPGTGVSIVEDGTDRWGTAADIWPAGGVPVRTIGPTWVRVEAAHGGIQIRRTVLCPEGDVPWLLIRVELASHETRTVDVAERWTITPRFVTRSVPRERQLEIARAAVRFDVDQDEHGVTLVERRRPAAEWEALVPAGAGAAVFGSPIHLRLESAAPAPDVATNGEDHPTVTLSTRVELLAGETKDLWYRFSADVPAGGLAPLDDPRQTFEASMNALRRRLPTGDSDRISALERELPWHAALLTGGACVDHRLGGHTLDQASAYSFKLGFNGAARDPLQHALPLVYSEPDLALSVLRNACAWAAPTGELPYALDGAKDPWTARWQPSDGALWSLWLAVEYATATGDLGAFAEPVTYHPQHGSASAPLVEHLVRQLRHLLDVVGFGEHGHLRIRNADWNDSALALAGVDRDLMIDRGESVLNSAMAAWVLPRFAVLATRLGLETVGRECLGVAEQLRSCVAAEWNGRWFRRARCHDAVVGDDDLWLEVQPWAILCCAADREQSRALLGVIDRRLRAGSPLGARLRWPQPSFLPPERTAGEGTAGGVWFSISVMLAWAAAQHDPELAWDELSRMTLAAHTDAYPDVWEGTVSGPDSYNAPESPRAGRTWAWPSTEFAMQSFPVNNLHAHGQVLLGYLRVLGVEPSLDGSLRVRGGGTWSSPVLTLAADGHGHLEALGAVEVTSPHGRATGGPGTAAW